ncbi:Protein of unknown function [Gryllus bimaculatus]|nr:Protein of unknown function [Gryllus bimaculatus]
MSTAVESILRSAYIFTSGVTQGCVLRIRFWLLSEATCKKMIMRNMIRFSAVLSQKINHKAKNI